jgi:predicted secreted protein
MASTSYINGASGALSHGGTTIAITGWTINVTTDTVDCTDDSVADGWRCTLPGGFKAWTGTATGFVIDGTVAQAVDADDAAASAIFSAEADITWTGNCYLTGQTVNLTIDGGDAVGIEYNFVGDGALTEANP